MVIICFASAIAVATSRNTTKTFNNDIATLANLRAVEKLSFKRNYLLK